MRRCFEAVLEDSMPEVATRLEFWESTLPIMVREQFDYLIFHCSEICEKSQGGLCGVERECVYTETYINCFLDF